MLSLVKIETTNSTPAYINPNQVVSVITARRSGTRDNCVKVALVNGDYIETDWTYAKVIAVLTQVTYDPSNDPDVAPAPKKDSLVAKMKTLLINIRNSDRDGSAIRTAQKLFDNRPSTRDVIIPLGYHFSAVAHIDQYCMPGGGYQVGIDLKIGIGEHPFQGGCCVRYGIPALNDLDFTPHCSIADEWDPALLELLVRQLEAWADAISAA